MAKKQKMWIYTPPKNSSPKIPENLKRDLENKAALLIKDTLKPKLIQPPPENKTFNYIVDVYTKWYRKYFYFCSKYNCPGPNAISPSFESKFARLEYIGNNKFALAYMRHTGQWFEIYTDLSIEQCLLAISNDPLFCD